MLRSVGAVHLRRLRLIKAGLVAIVLSLGLAAPVAAGPYEDAMAAYDSGDHATALRLLHPLADQGDAFAEFYLGIMYHNGEGVPQDYAMAAVFTRKAADQGNAKAQANLATLYAAGLGVPQDYVLAYMWFNLAAAHFPATDTKDHDKSIRCRDGVAAVMTPEQIAEAQKLASEWKPGSP